MGSQHIRDSDLFFAEDLVAIATSYRKFLKENYEYLPNLLKRPDLLTAAVKRYETLWLPLKKKSPDTDVLPPADVYWIWHAHMLSPVQYHKDCQRLVQLTPDHRFITPTAEIVQKSRQIWSDLYPEESYDLDLDLDKIAYKSKCNHDLKRAAEQNASYYYHVSLPHMDDATFLKHAVRRYSEFLLLKKREPQLQLGVIPMFDLDLIWRSHMMCPLLYKKETMELYRQPLDYDSRKLFMQIPSENKAAILKAWHIYFNEELSVPGCRNRGPDPRSAVKKMTKPLNAQGKESTLRLNLVPGEFKSDVVHGKEISEVLGPMALGYVPDDAEVHIDQTEHTISDKEGNKLLTLRILHTVDVHLSIIQIYHKGELISISHVIGHEQLVTEGQVGYPESAITIDAVSGERAMLVKTAKGDECVVKGVWKGYVGGSDVFQPKEKGYLDLSVFKLSSKTNDRSFVKVKPFTTEHAETFQYDGVEIDMNTGDISIDNSIDKSADSNDTVAKLSTALSILVVYILCEPRFEDGPMGIEDVGSQDSGQEQENGRNDEQESQLSDDNKEQNEQKEKQFKRQPLAGCRVLKILGLGKEVPSNNWFFWLFHRRIPEVFCPWEPDRSHRIIQDQMNRAKLERDQGSQSQALMVMLVSVIILLISVIAAVLLIQYDYVSMFY